MSPTATCSLGLNFDKVKNSFKLRTGFDTS
jgi:hypothetical protein